MGSISNRCFFTRWIRNETTHFFTAAACSALLLFIQFPAIAQEKVEQEQPRVPILTEEQAETLPKESTQGEDIPVLNEEEEQSLDKMQEEWSSIVIGAAEWLDSFFDDPRYLVEENRSRARLKLAFGYSRFNDFEVTPSLDLRLHLPRFLQNANLFLQANDDRDFDIDANPISNTEKSNDEEVTAGFQYFLAFAERYNISADAGISFNYLFAGLRYRYQHPFFSSHWIGRFTNRLRYYTDDGWENKASYDIERSIGERYFFRTILTGVVAERFDGVPFSTVARLYHVLNIDSALLYDVGVYFDTDPEFEVTDTQLRVRYRQRFFRDWLVLEVAPVVSFPSNHDHEMNPGLVIKFEADFGYLKDRKAYESIFNF